jgi:hypothetical protein
MFGQTDIARATFQNNETRRRLVSFAFVGDAAGGNALMKAE